MCKMKEVKYSSVYSQTKKKHKKVEEEERKDGKIGTKNKQSWSIKGE